MSFSFSHLQQDKEKMNNQKSLKNSDCESPQSPASPTDSHRSTRVLKRKQEKLEESKTFRKRQKSAANLQVKEQRSVDDNLNCDEAGSDISTTSTKKRKLTTAMPQFNKLQDIEDKSLLCVMGDNEANIFPKKLKFMDCDIDVMYDSRVHLWIRADEFAKALGYKNHKSSIERYVHPSFVRTFPEVLDMSRTRYGDTYRLYSVNSKVLFINEAGMLQLLLRSMITNGSGGKTKEQEDEEEDRSKYHLKPKLSADWINYQIMPSLIAFSEAAKNGITAQEERHLQSMNQTLDE